MFAGYNIRNVRNFQNSWTEWLTDQFDNDIKFLTYLLEFCY